MSDLAAVKLLDGRPTTFKRFIGPDKYVVSIEGLDRTISRDEWHRLPSHPLCRDVKPDIEATPNEWRSTAAVTDV